MPADPAHYDVILRGGTVYDGSGGRASWPTWESRAIASPPSAILASATAALEIDARGLAVAPGFINMLCWATESLLVDGTAKATSARA